MSVQLLAERTRSVRRPVSAYGTKESWEVGVHGCRDLPGFQQLPYACDGEMVQSPSSMSLISIMCLIT